MKRYTQRSNYDAFISEFVIAEASIRHPDAISRRLEVIDDIMELQAIDTYDAGETTAIYCFGIASKDKL